MTILTKILTGLLALTFIFAGTVKVTDQLDKNAHQEMLSKFQVFAPLWNTQLFGISGDNFRMIVGGTEILTAVALFTPYAFIAAGIQAVVMSGAIITHFRMNDGVGAIAPVVLALLDIVLVYSLTLGRPVAKKSKRT